MNKIIRLFCFIIIYLLLLIGILGVLLLDNIFKEVGYLVVIFLMLDTLYNSYRIKLLKNDVNVSGDEQ